MQRRVFVQRGSRGSLGFAEQRRDDRVPFGLDAAAGGRTAGAGVPVARIAEIAFETMQIDMHPGGVGVGVALRDRVRLVPVALRRLPQRRERSGEIRRRLSIG